MTDRLKKAAYVALIAAAVIVAAAVAGSFILGAIMVDTLHNSDVVFDDPAWIAEDMRSEDAYLAMYERFPDAIEHTDISPIGVNIDVGVIDGDTGNRLTLWLYADPYSSGYQMTVTCRDSGGNVISDDYALFSPDFIRTTDCVSP
jgi:hypothetical protein